jgi:TRAP-type mannitol/chloroaromatic compound transport system permease small subunit
MHQVMAGVVARIEGVIDRIGQFAALLALAIIGLMVWNVLLRYSMSLGAVWAQELEWHLLAALILLAMSYAMQRGDNVRVDLFYAKFSDQKKRVIDIVSALLTIAIALIMVKLSLAYVNQSFVINETSPDPGGIAYRWALKSLLPIGYGLLSLQALGQLLRLIFLHSPRPPASDSSAGSMSAVGEEPPRV